MANFVCEVLLTEAPLEGRAQECDATLKVASCKLQTCATSDVDLAAGAVVDFWGVVRRLEDGHVIDGIDYEAHREMAEHQLKGVAEQAAEKFGLTLVIIHHRIGFIAVGEPSLFMRVASSHRDEAFQASQWIVDELKKKVPIWKRPAFANPPSRKATASREGMGEPNYFEPAAVDGAFCGGAQLLLAVCTHCCASDFFGCRSYRFYRWRDCAALRSHHQFWQIDGPPRGQDHDGSSLYFVGSS